MDWRVWCVWCVCKKCINSQCTHKQGGQINIPRQKVRFSDDKHKHSRELHKHSRELGS